MLLYDTFGARTRAQHVLCSTSELGGLFRLGERMTGKEALVMNTLSWHGQVL